MTYALDLSGPWAKLERARRHVDQLRAEIDVAGAPDPTLIPLVRIYDPADRAVVYRIERVLTVGSDWALIVGDAIHNFRSALDHLAWQLALRYFNGVAPTDDTMIRSIQFPIFSDAATWPNHRFTRYMLPDDQAKVERVQPYHQPQGPNMIRGLEGLNLMSNHDKHRLLHVLVHAAQSLTAHNPAWNACTDCQLDVRPMSTGEQAHMVITPVGLNPRSGDEVMRIFVRPTGPHPDVDFPASLTGSVVIEGFGVALDALDSMYQGIAVILRLFET